MIFCRLSASCSFLVDHASLTKHVCLWKDIVQLWQQGKTPAHIAWELRQDSIYTTSQTVQHCIFTSTKGESPKDWRRSEWPSTITKKIMADINRMLEQVDKFTFSKIHRIIVKRFTVWILTSTIWCFYRLKLKWIVDRARTAPLFLVRNKKHWEFAGKCISDEDTIDVVWTDKVLHLWSEHQTQCYHCMLLRKRMTWVSQEKQ